MKPLTVDQIRVLHNVDHGRDPCLGVSGSRTDRRFDSAVQGLKRRGLVRYDRAADRWRLTDEGEAFARSMEVAP